MHLNVFVDNSSRCEDNSEPLDINDISEHPFLNKYK